MKFARILVLYASFWEDIYILLRLIFENTFIYSEAQHIYVFEVTFIHTQLTSGGSIHLYTPLTSLGRI